MINYYRNPCLQCQIVKIWNILNTNSQLVGYLQVSIQIIHRYSFKTTLMVVFLYSFTVLKLSNLQCGHDYCFTSLLKSITILQNKNTSSEYIFQNFNTIQSMDTDISIKSIDTVKQHNLGNKILNFINKGRNFYTLNS